MLIQRDQLDLVIYLGSNLELVEIIPKPETILKKFKQNYIILIYYDNE